jgi:hypothetical protein
MSSNNNCDIDLNKCEKSKKYKRADIDKIAKKCGINPDEYKNRKLLCEAIVAKNSSYQKEPISEKPKLKEPISEKPKLKEPTINSEDCNIKQNICEKSKKYNRSDIDDIAKKCGINPDEYKNRKLLCMAILEKRGETHVEIEPKGDKISPKCNKKSLQDCQLKDLQKIAKEENIKNYSKTKKDELIKDIQKNRKGGKQEEEEEDDDDDSLFSSRNRIERDVRCKCSLKAFERIRSSSGITTGPFCIRADIVEIARPRPPPLRLFVTSNNFAGVCELCELVIDFSYKFVGLVKSFKGK